MWLHKLITRGVVGAYRVTEHMPAAISGDPSILHRMFNGNDSNF